MKHAITTRRANALRTVRIAQGLTGAELARRAGVTKARMWAMERRPPEIWKRLCRLADVLGTTTDTLLGRSEALAAPAAGREDAALLKAMQRDAQVYLTGHPLLRSPGGWRTIARTMFLGGLTRIRDHGLPRPLPRVAEAYRKAPKGWYSTGWESPRQRARSLNAPDPKPPADSRRRALGAGR